jgi:pimeloyl-ACP methyl ester carboxylesterase/DNA-binding CsgD family transcriptional regulator
VDLVEQHIRFCGTDDGVRLAYALAGDGPPLVKAPNYLTHLEYDWDSPVWRHWMDALASRWKLVRYDERGCGMSDLDVDDFSLDTWVADLEVVVDEVGLDRFPLLGISAGGPVAIAYASRHPERVTKLVLYGSYARGRMRRSNTPAELREAELLLEMMEVGWGQDNPAFRRVFTTLFMPHGSLEQLTWFDELQRITTPTANAIRFERAFWDVDVRALASRVTTPTLVLHARDDAMCPFEGARELAGLIPDSELVPLEGHNHVLLEHEPAWSRFLAAVEDFLTEPEPAIDPRSARLDDLTPREGEVLALIARGLSNDEIAEQLVVSAATVRNHITRIFRKLGVRDRAQAVVVALEGGAAGH